jgi:PAS domain S-box-containing protein
MISFLKNIVTREIIHSISSDNILARQRYLLFRIVSVFGGALLMALAIYDLAISNVHTAVNQALIGVSLTLIINFLGLQFHRNFSVAYVTSIVAGLALIHGVTYFYGGIRNPDFLYIGSIILYSYVILENKGGRITLALSLLNVIYFYVMSDFTEKDTVITNFLTGSDIDTKHLYTAVISMVVMTSISSYLSYSKNAVIAKIEESKSVLEKKNEELQELSLVASETINSVVITDGEGRIEWVNEGFTRLTGYDLAFASGKKMSEFLYGPQSEQSVVNEIENRNFSGSTFDTEVIKYNNKGEPVWVQENITRINDETDNSVKYIFIESDINERKKSEYRMQEYLKNLEKTNRELDKFAYVVSHDLKAPLRAIGNLTGWIEEDTGHMLPGEVRKNFNLIKDRVVRMEALINGILDYSKVAKKNNQFETFELRNLIKEVTGMIGNPEGTQFIIQKDLPSVTADKVKLQQVFMNLIGNAIKFNNKPEKQVKIESTDFGTHFRFSITDNGPGIDPRFHEKIFQIFQTINTRDEFESNGVGLAIVKKIIDEQDARIWVESKPCEGSTFHFTWPKKPVVSERMNIYTPEKV